MKIILTMFSLLYGFSLEAVYKQLVDKMTLEEKVGQILMVHFVGEQINDDAKTLVCDLNVGGIIYYNWANKLSSPEQVKNLSFGLQNLSIKTRLEIPLFIAVDQEGGVVSRLTQGFTVFPGNKALGEINDPQLIKNAMYFMGNELNFCGINLNFAPVVDVNVNPKNPVIGIRAFGNDPKIVTVCAKAAIEGLKQAGIVATIKHFPGHGDSHLDSHYELPSIDKSLKQLQACELYPFKKLSKDCDVVMTGHLKVKALDDQNCATFSDKTLSYLRKKIGFKGVVISDSIVMNGALKNAKNPGDAAIKAFNAGCDIILIGGKSLLGSLSPELKIQEIKNIHQGLVQAVKEEKISIKRLDESVKRILALKDKYQITNRVTTQRLKDFMSNPEAIRSAKSIASRALSVKINQKMTLKGKKIAIFAPSILFSELSKTGFQNLSSHVSEFYYEGFEPKKEDFDKSQLVASDADVLVFFSYNAWKYEGQTKFINHLNILKKPAILVITRDPIDEELFENLGLVYKTFSPTYISLESVCDHLMETSF